jgi:hypothetical protein
MPKIAYVENRFQKTTLLVIDNANRIIEDWQAKGFKLTVRQIYYRFIALDWFPASWIDDDYNKSKGLPPGTKNTLRNYKRLIDILVIGRLGGLIDWTAIEDRTRSLKGMNHWDTTKEYLDSVRHSYRLDKWATQKVRFELWFEKDALSGIAEHIATQGDIDVQFFSSRGYSSESAMWLAAQRLNWYREELGQETVILQFSDHDPSGIDIGRDIKDRFALFNCPVKVQRMALTMAQVKKFKLPPNPAKENDIRFAGYVEKFGKSSWEMDALEPDYMQDITRKAILAARDEKDWKAKSAIEATQRELMKGVRVPVFGFGDSKKGLNPGQFLLTAVAEASETLAKKILKKWLDAGAPEGHVNVGVQFVYADQSPETHRKETKKGKKK